MSDTTRQQTLALFSDDLAEIALPVLVHYWQHWGREVHEADSLEEAFHFAAYLFDEGAGNPERIESGRYVWECDKAANWIMVEPDDYEGRWKHISIDRPFHDEA